MFIFVYLHLNMKKFRYRFQVGKEHIDSYGHVNNARYLDLFEEARWAILDQSNLGREEVRLGGIGPVILEVNLIFRQEILEGEEIIIETDSENLGDRIFYFNQSMENSKGELCCKARFKSALFDLNTRKMIKAEGKWLKAFGF